MVSSTNSAFVSKLDTGLGSSNLKIVQGQFLKSSLEWTPKDRCLSEGNSLKDQSGGPCCLHDGKDQQEFSKLSPS